MPLELLLLPPELKVRMKAEIIKKLEELLTTEDITSIKREVRDLLQDYNELTSKDRQQQFDAWTENDNDEGAPFEYTPAAEDTELDAHLEEYRKRLKEHGERIAKEQKANLESKEGILTKLEELVKTEENIGRAFSVFNELEEEWKKIGDVPGDRFKDIQERQTQLKNDFYYNINIYKELKEHDLKRNLEKKEALIEKAKELENVNEIKELELLTRSYQKEFLDVGPSPRENWKEIGDEFFGLIRTAFDRIQAHYDALREEYEANLKAKQDLVAKVVEIVELDMNNHGTWQKKTEEVLAIQKEWKTVGFVPRKDSDAVWDEFRSKCDQFFANKQAFYDQRKTQQKENKAKKEALCEKAEAIHESTDWKQTTDALIALQKEWKAVGGAQQSEERKLWDRFRKACDHFFEAKKKHFAGMDERQEENQKAKEDLIAQIEAFELTGNRSADLEQLRGFQEKWSGIGFVPRKVLKDINQSYYKAIDSKYDALKANRMERSVDQYKDRLENLKDKSDGDQALRRERRLLRDKIDRLNQRVIQYENNMNFFTGPGAADLKKDFEKKIRVAKEEIVEIRKKLKLFDEV